MIARILIPVRRSRGGLGFLFSTMASDPYFILGVEKTASIAQIKKAFYRLANQCHPDKSLSQSDGQIVNPNQQKERIKKFLLIKQAYETIKYQRGLSQPPGFIYDKDVNSVRPNPSRFSTDDEQARASNPDYKIYQQKAQDSQQYQTLKSTFKTVDDINDIKIRVEKGEMKDTSVRFDLESLRVNIKTIRADSLKYFLYIGIGFVVFYQFFLQMQQLRQNFDLQMDLQVQENKQKKRRIFDQDEIKIQKIKQEVKNNRDIKDIIQGKGKGIAIGMSRKREEIVTGTDSV